MFPPDWYDDEGHGPPKIEVIALTTALAANLLDRNPGNRPQRSRKAGAMARDIRSGNFPFTGDSIKLDWNGNMMDGQHRCLAVIEADAPIVVVLVSNLSPKVKDYLDEGTRRTTGDVLSMHGVPDASGQGALAVRVLQWEAGNPGGGGMFSPSRQEQIEALARWPEIEAIAASSKAYSRSLPGVQPASFGVAWWAFHQINPEQAEWFVSRLASDVGHEDNDPALIYRRTINNEYAKIKGALNRLWVTGITVKAWNLHRQGRKAKMLRYNHDGPTREPFPIPM